MNAHVNHGGRRSPGCTIDAVPKPAGAFEWQWRATDGTRSSKRPFRYFYECLQDARQHGYRVDVRGTVEHLRTRSDPSHSVDD
jgi:hypothetical protein